jgi:uncharacterized protein Yka (UPF0111/DUF47 family)
MANPLYTIVRNLRSPAKSFAEILLLHIDATLESALLVRSVLEGKISMPEARKNMKATEHLGDSIREQLVRKLSQTIVTPIDREDLFRLSRAVDDVIDNLRDFLREMDLYEITTGHYLLAPTNALIEAISKFEGSIKGIAEAPKEVSSRALAAKKACNMVRRACQHQQARLFKQPLSQDILKRLELLHRLDSVGRHLDEAANILADAEVKLGE